MSFNNVVDAGGSSGFANFDAFASHPAVAGGVAGAAVVGGVSTVGGAGGVVGPVAPPPVSADKYSALVELEGAFGAPTVPVMWDEGMPSGGRGSQANWGAQPATTSAAPVFGTGSAPQAAAVPTMSGFVYGGGGGANVVPNAVPAAGFNPAAAGMPLVFLVYLFGLIDGTEWPSWC